MVVFCYLGHTCHCINSKNYHQWNAKDIDRANVIAKMQEKGIPVMIYYPVPLHLQKAYINYGYKEGDFPVTEELCKHVISLPMHTELDDEQLQYITSSLLEVINA